MLHAEHLRDLRDHQCDYTLVDESEMQNDELVPITFPPLIWVSQHGKKVSHHNGLPFSQIFSADLERTLL